MSLRDFLRPLLRPIPAKWTFAVALGLPAVMLLGGLSRSGLWDPYEVTVAELARRIAVNAFHANGLVLANADNGLPTLGDLGRGELPFDSIALGFKLFGLHEWSGRLPLAIWGFAGVIALYWFLSRFVDRRAGMYGTFVLVSMPLYFVQARTVLGDIVTIASITIAFAGLAIATLAPARADGAPATSRERLLALAVGAVGLVAGFESRGALLGVVTPVLAIGLSWAITRLSRPTGRSFGIDWMGDALGALLLVGAAIVIWRASIVLSSPIKSEYSPLVGITPTAQTRFPTFDYVILFLGHGLFPWSAFLPFAVGRLFLEPRVNDAGSSADGSVPPPPAEPTADENTERALSARRAAQSHARIALLVGSAVAFGTYSLVAPRAGHVAFGAPALLAGIIAVALRDFERGAPASRAMGTGVVILTALFLRDFDMFPEKALSPFAVSGGTIPDSFKVLATKLLRASGAIFAVILFFSWLERATRPWFDWDEYLTLPKMAWQPVAKMIRALTRRWLYGLAVFEALLVAIGGFTWISLHLVHISFVSQLGMTTRVALINAPFWPLLAPVGVLLVSLGVMAIVWGVMTVRDLFRLWFHFTGISRALMTSFVGLAAGCILWLSYYPALAAQLSPKEVFDSYSKLHAAGEPLGLLGVEARAASYESGGQVRTFSDANLAFSWLTTGPGRRWLALRNDDMGKLNSMFRGLPERHANLPILDARSSQILLASNELGNNTNHNPFSSMLLDHEPVPQHRVDVVMQDGLVNLGWEVRDSADRLVDFVTPSKKYHFRIFYKVGGKIGGEWETFIHIDGHQRRFNGDHKTLGGKYPFSLWQPGDYVVDDAEIALEPNFTAGSYDVYYGLYLGETRLKVVSGPQDDGRIAGGALKVQ